MSHIERSFRHFWRPAAEVGPQHLAEIWSLFSVADGARRVGNSGADRLVADSDLAKSSAKEIALTSKSWSY